MPEILCARQYAEWDLYPLVNLPPCVSEASVDCCVTLLSFYSNRRHGTFLDSGSGVFTGLRYLPPTSIFCSLDTCIFFGSYACLWETIAIRASPAIDAKSHISISKKHNCSPITESINYIAICNLSFIKLGMNHHFSKIHIYL